MARIDYVDEEDLDPDRRGLLVSSLPIEEISEEYRHLMQDTKRNSYCALGHVPEVLELYRDLIDELKERSGLDEYEQEVIILTLASEIGSRYEWHNHARIALDSGIDREDIVAISDRDYDRFEDRYSTLMRYVIRFTYGTIDDDLHAEMAEYYDEKTIVGISVFAGYWLMNARVVHALAIETEESFVGWNLENA
jgi:alkylhydroperoxidase family enzyme